VQRNFTAACDDEVWLTDITEHPTTERKLYCCTIKDLFSNRIVGYALDEHMTAGLATAPHTRRPRTRLHTRRRHGGMISRKQSQPNSGQTRTVAYDLRQDFLNDPGDRLGVALPAMGLGPMTSTIEAFRTRRARKPENSYDGIDRCAHVVWWKELAMASENLDA
jgi:hypothetical protein